MSCSVVGVKIADDVLMAKGYRRVDRDQQFLLPESMRDWLPDSDPVWLVIAVVDGLDTSGLHAQRRTGAAGRAGYDPDMLLTLLIWAWAQGVRSSRVIERLCRRDVGFRIICAGDAPDHVTISRFRAEAAEACEDLFAQVLGLCAQVGMGQLGVVAIDSVKIASNASLSANRTEDGLRKAAAEQASIDAERARELAAAAAAEHAGTDAAEDQMYGSGRGDEVPADLIDPRSRAARIDQAIAELKARNVAGGRDKEAAAARARDREQKIQKRRHDVAQKYRSQRDQERQLPTGRPPVEIRIQVLEENLAVYQARAQAKVDAWRARPFRGGHVPTVESDTRVKLARAALARAVAAQAETEQAVAGVSDGLCRSWRGKDLRT